MLSLRQSILALSQRLSPGSILLSAVRGAKLGTEAEANSAPPLPSEMVRAIRDHNRLFHGADSAMIDWDCKWCDKLQGEYAGSLNYHTPRITPGE